MPKMRYLLFSILLSVTSAYAANHVFPREYPLDLRKAEAQGLHRLSAEELKAFIPGTMEALGADAKKGKIRIYRPDGSFEGQGFHTNKGTWRIDSKDNTWCRTIVKKMQDQEKCFAVFRAPDGIHYFDYDMTDNFYAGSWRPKQK